MIILIDVVMTIVSIIVLGVGIYHIIEAYIDGEWTWMLCMISLLLIMITMIVALWYCSFQ